MNTKVIKIYDAAISLYDNDTYESKDNTRNSTSIIITYDIPVGPLTSGSTYYLNVENNAPNGKAYYLRLAGQGYTDETFL